MRKLTVVRLSEITLPAAWFIWGAGFLPGAMAGIDVEKAFWFQVAASVGLLLAATAWLGRGKLVFAGNAGWHSGLLVMLVLATAMGMMLGSAQPAMFAAALAGLAWWDLVDFTRRLRQFDHRDLPGVDLLVAAHLRRLALALGLGLASGLAALSVSIKLTLEGAMMLGALAVFLVRLGVERALRS